MRALHGEAGPARAGDPYARFASIDGRHPLRSKAPTSCVVYAARQRRGSRVVYFNFELAREMGLLDPLHPDRLTPGLKSAILGAFSLQIINEYDLRHGTPIRRADRLPRSYAATRYLQIQHASRRGTTSGDGRSIWNGVFRANGTTWDLSSCGTGVTRLCPATSASGRYYKTGSRRASYGCGTSSVEEGLTAAVMSEVFHRNGIATERVLAVLRLANGYGITVRAARCLLRPAHFFAPLKQGRREELAALVDLFIERRVANGEWPRLADPAARYALFADELARTFGRTAATFEREYVFCWLEWDGDNILADGGIIDYGSVRQFGLFHREYRYDDGPRWSTTITGQKAKARYIAQCGAQIREFLVTGRKPPLSQLRHDPVLALFDAEFERTRDRLLLRNAGFDERTAAVLLARDLPLVRRFDRVHARFERARSARGPVAVPDGITWNAIFSTRDLLREIPRVLLRRYAPIPARDVLAIGLSSYATAVDRRRALSRAADARAFERLYRALLERAARRTSTSVKAVLAGVAERSASINRYARLTGDSTTWVARELLVRSRRGREALDLNAALSEFVSSQSDAARRDPPAPSEIGRRLLEIVVSLRHGL